MIQKNTPDIWDTVWEGEKNSENYVFDLKREEHSIRWRRIEKIVTDEFGDFSALRVIEIGAGMGTNSALMAKRGADVTILDYSDNALKKAQDFFHSNNLHATFIKADALDLPPHLLGNYDISMSFGLAEHFTGQRRLKIIANHRELLASWGLSFISVPNSYNIPYRIFKFVAEKTGRWNVGEEYPFSRNELHKICKKLDIKKYFFTADSFFYSISFINPFTYIYPKQKKQNKGDNEFKLEKGTPFDEYIAYAIVLCIKK